MTKHCRNKERKSGRAIASNRCMKHKILSFGLVGMSLLGVAAWNVAAGSSEQRHDFSMNSKFTFAGVDLKPGNYVVIHREEAMKEGAECTFIYRAPYRGGKEAVAKARCTPVEGTRAKLFRMESTQQPDGTLVIHGIQFAGSTTLHTYGTGS